MKKQKSPHAGTGVRGFFDNKIRQTQYTVKSTAAQAPRWGDCFICWMSSNGRARPWQIQILRNPSNGQRIGVCDFHRQPASSIGLVQAGEVDDV